MTEEYTPSVEQINREEIILPTTPAPDALNKINALYYGACPDAFSPESELAGFLNSDEVQQALAEEIENYFPDQQNIRVKEVMAGSRTDRIDSFIRGFSTNKNIEMVVSDFSANSLPSSQDIDNLQRPNVVIRTEEWSAFEPMEQLPQNDRFDCIYTTYGFDSVWHKSDSRVIKREGQWYRVNYQIKVPGDKPRLAREIDAGESERPIPLSDFEGIEVIDTLDPIDISSIPYGNEVAKRYDSRGDKRTTPPINVPGGLIETVQTAFNNQLSDRGIFVICDVAINDDRGFEGFDPEVGDFSNPKVMGIETTGKVAKYKIEDYGLAQQVLESRGYSVTVTTLQDFLFDNNIDAPTEIGKEQKVMVVKRS